MSTELITLLAEKVKSFGVSFAEGVGDDCAAAVAILLFGNTGTKLPGGYAGEEISVNSVNFYDITLWCLRYNPMVSYTADCKGYRVSSGVCTTRSSNCYDQGNLLLIYICNFHVLSHLLLIYICKLHWNPGDREPPRDQLESVGQMGRRS